MTSLDVSTISGKERTLFIVASLDITVLIPSTYVLCGVCVVLRLSSWVFRFL
jgi:threonine/homoserine/homoserine lactone efflux protein